MSFPVHMLYRVHVLVLIQLLLIAALWETEMATKRRQVHFVITDTDHAFLLDLAKTRDESVAAILRRMVRALRVGGQHNASAGLATRSQELPR